MSEAEERSGRNGVRRAIEHSLQKSTGALDLRELAFMLQLHADAVGALENKALGRSSARPISVGVEVESFRMLRALHRVEVTAHALGIDALDHHLELTRFAILDELGLTIHDAHALRAALAAVASEYESNEHLASMLRAAVEQMGRLSEGLRR